LYEGTDCESFTSETTGQGGLIARVGGG